MSAYLIINILFSLSVILAIHRMHKAPFRILFYMSTFGLISWLVPYHLLQGLLAKTSIKTYVEPIQTIGKDWVATVNPMIEHSPLVNMNWLGFFISLSALGLLRFVIDLVAMQKQLKTQRNKSMLYKKKHNYSIYSVKELQGAHTSGYFEPVIWVDESLMKSSELNTLLIHEQQHIKQHDSFWLLLICFIQRLFWWNPLVIILSQKSRNFIELSCDQACAKKLGKDKYQKHLASILLNRQADNKTPLFNHFFAKKSLNIIRIKYLNQEPIMTIRNKIIILFTGGLFCFSLGLTLLISPLHAEQTKSNLELQNNHIVLNLELRLVSSEPNVDGKPIITEVFQERYMQLQAGLNRWSEVHMSGYKIKIKANQHGQENYHIELSVHNEEIQSSDSSNPSIIVQKNTKAGVLIAHPKTEQDLDLSVTVSS